MMHVQGAQYSTVMMHVQGAQYSTVSAKLSSVWQFMRLTPHRMKVSKSVCTLLTYLLTYLLHVSNPPDCLLFHCVYYTPVVRQIS